MTKRLVALGVLFALDGVMMASWAVRVPQVKQQVGASATGLGLALLCSTVGALVAMPLAGRLCHRYGSHRVTVVGSILLSLVVVVPTLAGSVVALGAALLLFGVGYGVNNVGLNSSASDVEVATGRAVMSTLHGLWSVGLLGGALVGGLVADHLLPTPHLALVGLGGLVVVAVCAAPVWAGVTGTAGADDKPDTARSVRAVLPALVGFGVIALCCAYGEGSMSDWGALHLADDLRTGASTAAYGFAVYSVAVAAGRFGGDVLVARLGRTAVLSGGGVLAALGMLLAAWPTSVPLVFAGYVVFGLGIANVFPIAIARAGALAGPKGVATASTVGYAGQLGGPPLIGFLADAAGMPVALTTSAVLAVLAAALGFALRTATPKAVVEPALTTGGHP
ncbi:MFS transporter [Actinocatenispora rupis]|uniref:MFS transporter n=1 Tax=Actinocatenispora rupis TaxID=519421 RepID=A0A8J3J8S6_9ACTN|nr:MFS transporter [Actinocatenispora rupis]GID16088.1 MFS transporter [Actinocatenispora rupis]